MSRSPSAAPRLRADTNTASRDDRRLYGRWLMLARAVWVATALVTVALEVVATPVMLHLLQTVCVSSPCAQQLSQLTPAQAHDLRMLGMLPGFYAVFVIALQWAGTLIYVGVATVIFWRRSDDGMALFAAFMLLTFTAAAGNGWASVLASSSHAWAVLANLIGITGQIAFYVFFCLFPSGHFVPQWMRWPALLWAVLWLLTLLPFAPLNAVVTGTSLPFFAFIGVLVLAQVYRYQGASAAERQQTKWVVFGFTLGVGGFLALLVFGQVALSPEARNNGASMLFAGTALTMLLWLVPIFIGIAILRSKLWDIDILINRTLVYGSLTAILAAIYFGVVIGLQALTTALTGQTNTPPVIIVASTLLIAALFNPLRRRIQTAIDHRFYRRKYDAARTLATFAATLRSEVELNALQTHLTDVVTETMQPAHVSLWLRTTERRGAAGSREPQE